MPTPDCGTAVYASRGLADAPDGVRGKSPPVTAHHHPDLIGLDFTVNAAAVGTRWCGEFAPLVG
ncbi:hypothetical protein [Actinoplanes aureus]|uniref:Uncharacterized protein n=1 Tax=Actinoplanes aureus TaxID=2792083 RepID=A0A931CBV7_9ACTN|nr:hypothetical protein [Actinoplanes aureus]MBG0567065.1 hypothetical protein [Actinoplanes aureus]